MIIKERSLYRKFLDWHKRKFNRGLWEVKESEEGFSNGTGIIIFLIIFLAWYFDGVWQPIFDNIINDIMTYFS